MNYAINEGLTGNFAWLNGRPLFASISGGKDSTALGLWLKDNGIKFTPVFIDTGWEHQATYDYIKDVLTPLFGEFITLSLSHNPKAVESLPPLIEAKSGRPLSQAKLPVKPSLIA